MKGRLVLHYILICIGSLIQRSQAFQRPYRSTRRLITVSLSQSTDENQETRRKRVRAAKQEVQKRKQAQQALDLPEQPLVRTIGGGTSLMMRMARRLWEEEAASETPRWHQKSHPSKPNAQGYAGTIWRNARKGKPSLWRYALRTFDNMTVEATNGHYLGALVACAKLGEWQKAMELFSRVQKKQADWERLMKSSPGTVYVTDAMISAVIRACVRASRRNDVTNPQEPLDRVVELLLTLREDHSLVASHWNPIAAAYQRLGQVAVAEDLLETHLSNRTIGPEPEDGSQDVLNVHDLQAKDKASYALLVQGAVGDHEWVQALDQLQRMTQDGLYPTQRHLHVWNERVRAR